MEMIRKFVKRGIFERSRSPYSCKLLAIPKKVIDGRMTYRLVQTLVELSDKSILQNFQLDSPRDQIQSIPDDARYFTTTDFKDSFYEIPLRKVDRPLTAFRAPDGNSYRSFSRYDILNP